MPILFDELFKAAPDAFAIAEAAERRVAEAIYAVFHRLAAATDRIAVAAAQRSSLDIVRAVRTSAYDRHLAQAIDKLDPVFVAGGELMMGQSLRKATLSVSFDARNEATSQFLRGYKMDLIRQIVADQERSVNATVLNSMIQGKAPKAMARAIMDVVGLTRWQGQQVQAYREQLESLDPTALQRQLRDKRFDGPVARAIESGEALDGESIDRYVNRYRDNWMRYRAVTIARTETLRAANAGGRAAVQQRLADPELEGFDVVKTWAAKNDEKTRDSHRSMDGQEVTGMDTPFTLPNGQPIRFPQDPRAPAEEAINCRCTIHYRLVPKTVPGGQAAF